MYEVHVFPLDSTGTDYLLMIVILLGSHFAMRRAVHLRSCDLKRLLVGIFNSFFSILVVVSFQHAFNSRDEAFSQKQYIKHLLFVKCCIRYCEGDILFHAQVLMELKI